MADNVEKIVVDLDVEEASASADKLSAELLSIEDKATRMGQAANLGVQRTVLTVSQTSQRAINATVDSYTRATRQLTQGQVAAQQTQFESALRRVAGDPKAIREVTDAYKERLRVIDQIQKKEQEAVVAQARYRAATPLQRVQLDFEREKARLGNNKAAIAELAQVYAGLEKQATGSMRNISDRVTEFITSPTYAARKTVADLADGWGKFGIIAGGALVVFGTAAKLAFDLVAGVGKQAEGITQLGERLGISAGEAAVLSAQARIAGVDVGSLSGLVRKLSTDLADGSNESRGIVKALEDIGVKVGVVGGKFRDPVAILRDFSAQLNKIPDHATRVDLLSRAFGRGAVELLPLIKNFAELERQARETGVGMDENLIKRMAEVDDKLDKLGISWDRLRLKMAEKIVAVVEVISSLVPGANDREIEERSRKLAEQYAGIGTHAVERIKPELSRAFSIIRGDVAAAANAAAETEERAVQAVVNRFRNRRGLEGLQQQLVALQKQRDQQSAGIVTGRSIKDVTDAEKQTLATERLIEAKKEEIRIFQAIPGAEKAAREGALRSIKEQQDAIGAASLSIQNLSETEIKYYQEQKKALDKYNESAAKYKADGTFTGVVSVELQKSLLADLQTAFVHNSQERIKLIEEEGKKARDYYSDRLKQEIDFQSETMKIRYATGEAALNFEETIVSQQRDRSIRALESIDAKTLQQKVQFEIAKGAVEEQFARQSFQARRDANRRALDFELAQLDGLYDNGTIKINDFYERKFALLQSFDEKERELQLTAIADIEKAREESTIRARQTIIDANTRVFDQFKRESEGVLDAMFTKSQNVFQAIGNMLKSVFLTVLKDIVSTQSARYLTQIFTGQKVGLTPGTISTGPLGKLGELLGIGSRPTFPNTGELLKSLKIEQSGRIGDLSLVSSGGVSSMPVMVMNPGDISSTNDITNNSIVNQEVKATRTSSQVNQQFSIPAGGGFSGASRAPVAASLAALTILGLGSAAQASPTGYKPLVEQVTSSISYGPGSSTAALSKFGERGGFTGQGDITDLVTGGATGAQPGTSGTVSKTTLASKLSDMFGLGRVFDGSRQASPTSSVSVYNPETGQYDVHPQLSGQPAVASRASSLKGLFGSGGKDFLFNSGGVTLSPGVGLGPFGALGKAAGIASSPFAALLGTSAFLSGITSKNPRGIGAFLNSAGGGALAGFALGSKIPGVGAGPGAAIGGGLGLLIGGYRRHDAIGIAQSTAGGFLAGAGIGFAIGGPIGAAVGAAIGTVVGAVTGIVGFFKESPEEKLRKKIKSLYGIDIRDNKYLAQMMEVARQSFGGNIDVAVRSQQIREMVELYAQATGQNSKGIVDRAQPSRFANQGGQLVAQPSFFNGEAVFPGDTSSSIGVPTITGRGGQQFYSPSVGGANVVRGTIQLDGDATRQVLQGQAAEYVAGNGRAVASSAQSGMTDGAGRRQISSQVLRPAFVPN